MLPAHQWLLSAGSDLPYWGGVCQALMLKAIGSPCHRVEIFWLQSQMSFTSFLSLALGRCTLIDPNRDDASVRGQRLGCHIMPRPIADPECLSLQRAWTRGVQHQVR